MNNYLYTFYTDNLHYEKFADGSVKCIEDEIPFDVPKGWAWTRLDSISEIITKGASPKWQGVDYTTSGTLFVTSENVGNETLLMDSPKYLSDRINEIQPRSVLKKHDILTNIVGASIGRTCEYTLDALANTNQAVAIIRLVDLRLVDFIVKCLSSAYSIDLMLKNQVNVARANLSLSSLAKFLIPIPPFIEKERIMKKVSLMFIHIDAISENKTDLETTISMAKSKILDLAIRGQLVPQNPDDEPASVLLDRIRAEKEELIKQGKIKRDKKESTIFKGEDNSYYEKFSDGKCRSIEDELPFELPDGWEWCNLSMIGTTNIGLTYRPTDIDPTGTMVLRSNNIVDDEIDLNDLVRVKTKIRENQYVQPNDILICARNGSKALVGKCALIDELKEPASFGAFMAVYKTDYYKYVLHYLRSSQFRNVFDDGNSTAINQLTQDMLKRALIPFPPISEQERIVNRISELLSRLRDIEKSLS